LTVHDLSGAAASALLEPIARRALERYDAGPEAGLTLLNVSENATYAVDDPVTGERTVLRIHRRGYHAGPEIASELAWVEALRVDAGVRTPRVLPTRDGAALLAMPEPGQAEPRYAVMFEWLPGTEPPDDRLDESFELLGEITARMHDHAEQWTRPSGFVRFAWDYDGSFGPASRWGRWQDGIAVGAAETEVLGRLDVVLRDRLARFGSERHRYGLVHADLRLANLLVHGGDTFVIDFDDCGWSWYLYDFGAAVSFFEHDPRVPELAERWLRGYRRVRDLPAEDEAELWTFVMMRRLLLVAWIGSHSGTDLAQSMGADYTRDSLALAEDYLMRFG
jgi:Ser/Thr protein kinase RdoA (MazF antagonist)